MFAVVTILPAAGLAWLGSTLIGQERERAESQLRARLEREIDALGASVARELAMPERAADQPGVEARSVPSPRDSIWGAAESAEFTGRYDAALALYTRLADTADSSIRAGALVRQARVLRRTGRGDVALRIYESLKAMDDVSVFDAPVSLWAALARIRELDARKDHDARDREAEAVRMDLAGGRWRVDRATFENAWLQVTTPVLLADGWRRLAARQGVAIVLSDARGTVLFQAGALSGPTVLRMPADTGLPWTIRLSSATPHVELAAFAGRRRQLLLLMALATFLVLAGAYFVARGIRRELALAELQSSFVSAVSHEFRTPLTSMSHLIELLQDRPDIAPERRSRYYQALEHEAERLRRFVDQLLDFGRAEEGAAGYRIVPTRPAALIEDVVARFRRGPAAGRHSVSLLAPAELPEIAADAEALAVAVNNLLENAAKYSPAGSPILVTVRHDGVRGRLLVEVQDSGPGIPRDEHEVIFDRFVRGRDARASTVRGTGVGLALARQIVRAHRGDVLLASEPGHGSTFTISLPVLIGSQTS